MALAAEELRADGERSSPFSGSALGSLLHDGLILKFWRLAHAAWPEGASCPNPAAAMNPRAAHSAHQSPAHLRSTQPPVQHPPTGYSQLLQELQAAEGAGLQLADVVHAQIPVGKKTFSGESHCSVHT